MLTWANAGQGRYIIEDDYDSEFRANSLSSTIRISYMVLPEHLINRYDEFSARFDPV